MKNFLELNQAEKGAVDTVFVDRNYYCHVTIFGAFFDGRTWFNLMCFYYGVDKSWIVMIVV